MSKIDRVKIQLIEFLTLNEEYEYTARALSEELKLPRKEISAALKQLDFQIHRRFVICSSGGYKYLYSLNS